MIRDRRIVTGGAWWRRLSFTKKFVCAACLVAAPGVIGRCSSSALPPVVSSTVDVVLRDRLRGVAVAVQRHSYPVYSDRLLAMLRGSELFGNVGYEGDVLSPSLIARVEEEISGAAVIPIATILSLGIVPTNVGEDWGDAFSLGSPHGVRVVPLDIRYRGVTTLGWLGGVRGLFLSDFAPNPRQTRRFQEWFTARVIDSADSILMAAGK